MIQLRSSQTQPQTLVFSEPYTYQESDVMLRFRASFHLNSLPYTTVWVHHRNPVDLVVFFQHLLCALRENESKSPPHEEMLWRSDEGHLAFSASFASVDTLRLHCTLCSVPKRDPKGISLTLLLQDAGLSCFLTEISRFFSVALPKEAMLPQENWEEWTPLAPLLPITSSSPATTASPYQTAQTEEAKEAEEDIWASQPASVEHAPIHIDPDEWSES
jgi:hypothetical protein